MAALGPGVERIAEEVAEVFPDAKVEILSSDLSDSARGLKERIAAIAAGEADIIIGTQMVAKGHNFPHLTLVGVIDADLGLQGGDLRAAEKSFQLIRQVAGRAGRAEKPGRAFLQSFQPAHPVIEAILSGDEEAFWRTEAKARLEANMPPYGRLAAVIVSSPKQEQAFEIATHLARNAQPLLAIGAQVLGPAAAPIAKIRDRYRVRLLIKVGKGAPLQKALRQWVKPREQTHKPADSLGYRPANILLTPSPCKRSAACADEGGRRLPEEAHPQDCPALAFTSAGVNPHSAKAHFLQAKNWPAAAWPRLRLGCARPLHPKFSHHTEKNHFPWRSFLAKRTKPR